MTSNDNQQYITVELFNSKMETFITQIRLDNEQLRNELNSKIDSVRNELRSEIQAVSAQVQVNSAKIEMLQHTFYWGFAILALIVAFVPMFRRERKEKQPEQGLTREKIQEIVREIIAESAGNVSTAGK
ncbi:MAG: hypothetical protein IJG36_07030 [Synergistaceae bacterium]|nr:hypothetical protein [Synergistaceae bacterium]